MTKQIPVGLEDLGLVKNQIRFNKHKKRKNNDKVAAMYAAYCDGMSLHAIGKMYRKTRQAIYDVFRSRGYPLRSKQLKGLQVFDGIKFTEAKGGHLRGTTPFGRMLMHQYVWQKTNGPIPDGHYIFHKDRDPKNNELTNLELLAKKDMSKKFNPSGRNQFSK